MILSKEEILNIFNNFAIDATFTLIIVSFISLIMYAFLKRKILFKTSISFLLLSAVILSSFIYFNEIDLFLLNQKNQYIYNKITEDIKNKEENQKNQAFREFIAKIGVTWTLVSEILGHQNHFYLDTKIGIHLDTFLVTPMKKINLS